MSELEDFVNSLGKGKPDPSPQDPEKLEASKQEPQKKAIQIPVDKYAKQLAEEVQKRNQSKPADKIEFGEGLRQAMPISGSSYGLIYKGQLPVRIVPFLWQMDSKTQRTWAVFNADDFYGRKPSIYPWRRVWTRLVITPFDKSGQVAEAFGKGYLAKFDEATQFQMPFYSPDKQTLQNDRIDNEHFISEVLTLKEELTEYLKPKLNMRFILTIIIVIGIAALLIWFFLSHPNMFSGLTQLLTPR